MIRAAYQEYKREVLAAPPLLQLLTCWCVALWGLTFLHARELGRLRLAVAR